MPSLMVRSSPVLSYPPLKSARGNGTSAQTSMFGADSGHEGRRPKQPRLARLGRRRHGLSSVGAPGCRVALAEGEPLAGSVASDRAFVLVLDRRWSLAPRA